MTKITIFYKDPYMKTETGTMETGPSVKGLLNTLGVLSSRSPAPMQSSGMVSCSFTLVLVGQKGVNLRVLWTTVASSVSSGFRERPPSQMIR